MEVTGTVIFTDTQKGTSKAGRPWQKKVFAIEFMEGTYTKHLAFEMFGEDRINNNPVRKGQTVTVSYDVESDEYNGRWYTTCSAWRVAPFDPNKPTTQPVAAPVSLSDAANANQGDNSDLPF